MAAVAGLVAAPAGTADRTHVRPARVSAEWLRGSDLSALRRIEFRRDYVFPLRARHTYGDGFGAARAGHRHQGQDVFASCGTPIRAVRGGRVQVNKYESAAGNYLVVDGAGTGRDFVYDHMSRLSPLRVGAHVDTGQVIGRVGETGDASACHLHFEIWSSPGWYEGGHPFDPRPSLRRWDRSG